MVLSLSPKALDGTSFSEIFPCGDRDESRFSPDFQIPLSIMGMEVIEDPNFPRDISRVQVLNGCKQRFEGPISSTPSMMPYKRARMPPDRLSGCKSTYDTGANLSPLLVYKML
jgi:hypothetical protein